MAKETPEKVFFDYSCSCTTDLFNEGLIEEEDFKKMIKYAETRTTPSRGDLEKVYKNAFERIRKLAEDEKKEPWNTEVIRRYFLQEHNKVIDRGDGYYEKAPHSIRELCKVRVGKVIEMLKINRELCYNVDYGNNQEIVVAKYFPDAQVGDKISTHWKFAVEKLPDENEKA